ncbi:MAG: ATP-binding protein [Solirubrobacterales bacterium]
MGRQEHDARELQLAAEAGSVRLARRAASDFAFERGVDPDAVALAVSEAVTNAVLHAYRDGPPGEIVLGLQPSGEGIAITVADAGSGIRPNLKSPGLGLGLALVASLADELAISESRLGGTALRMRFRS